MVTSIVEVIVAGALVLYCIVFSVNKHYQVCFSQIHHATCMYF